jgi:hypothetical protein
LSLICANKVAEANKKIASNDFFMISSSIKGQTYYFLFKGMVINPELRT